MSWLVEDEDEPRCPGCKCCDGREELFEDRDRIIDERDAAERKCRLLEEKITAIRHEAAVEADDYRSLVSELRVHNEMLSAKLRKLNDAS